MLFSNRGEKVSMGHFKETETGFTNILFSRIGSKKGFVLITSFNLEMVVASGRRVVVCGPIVVVCGWILGGVGWGGWAREHERNN